MTGVMTSLAHSAVVSYNLVAAVKASSGLTFPSRREDVQTVPSDAAELLCDRKLLAALLAFSLPGREVGSSAPCRTNTVFTESFCTELHNLP